MERKETNGPKCGGNIDDGPCNYRYFNTLEPTGKPELPKSSISSLERRALNSENLDGQRDSRLLPEWTPE